MRFFSTPSADLYDQTRLSLDAAWGLPNDRGTVTCINPVAAAPRDGQNRVLLAVADEWCEWEPAATILPQLLGSGAVVEISEADYQAAILPEWLQTHNLRRKQA
jgi:hypothetical protein